MNDLKKEIIGFLLKENREEVFIHENDKFWTREEIAKEIEGDTKEGKDFVNRLVLFTLELVIRGKQKLNVTSESSNTAKTEGSSEKKD